MTKKPAPFDALINVTRPLMPPLEEYTAELRDVWDAAWLTNNGAKHIALEQALGAALQAPHLSLFNNGTMALSIALSALEIEGEVITTPFTFPATPHVVAWSGATPVFADVHPQTLTLDPASIAARITSRTSAILAVHVYGMPCDVVGIQKVADAHRLKVIYDGAHAFGTEINGAPIASFGDATMFSFHATKLFHTAEGGALAMRDAAAKQRVDLLKNFGIRNETEVALVGVNGKMNELQAALGLVVLRHWEAERAARLAIADIYRARLGNLGGLRCFDIPEQVRNSAQYFVIRVAGENARLTRDGLYDGLKSFNIFTRRYFYPLCSECPPYRDAPSASRRSIPVAAKAAEEVLALPFYGALGADGANKVCDAIEHLMAGA